MDLHDRQTHLLLTRRWPTAVEDHLATLYDVQRNEKDEPLDRAALATALVSCDIVCPTITDRLDAALLSAPGNKARMLANFGAGLDHIDLAAARAAGLIVTNTPDALTDATADLAILLMLMAARRAGEGEREVRAGAWAGWRPTHMMGQSLAGKTIGLVGFGRIGRAVAARAAAFGMRVVYHSRRPGADADGTWIASLEELAAEADILSLHVPGGAETHHLIDAALLGSMKPSAILVNTARGTVIDEVALAAALAEGRIAAAGLDVYEREPAITPALLSLENAVLLPHLGSATIETRTAMGMQAATNIAAFLAGQSPPNRIA